ncbi:unnamed protein product [Prorocentrum cordatum]|uniref:Integral membrane protein n=1 Tax=Prorocentrum cordatum TaxID=2364126 RepID=A0ABN9T7N0_9DINO|nr:unnamed protein product [Polarella glacialis]
MEPRSHHPPSQEVRAESALGRRGVLLSMDGELAVELAAHLTVQVVPIAVCLLLAKRRWPRHKDPWMLADTLTSLVVFPVLTAAAVRGVLDLRHTPTSRWTGPTARGLVVVVGVVAEVRGCLDGFVSFGGKIASQGRRWSLSDSCSSAAAGLVLVVPGAGWSAGTTGGPISSTRTAPEIASSCVLSLPLSLSPPPVLPWRQR